MKPYSNKLAGAGVLSAVAASLCCITPVLALISGASGAASAFTWMDPFRPFLIGITVLVLGFAWYQKLKPRTAQEIACECEEDEKPSVMQSKKFLSVVTVFAILMLAFPYYSGLFYNTTEKELIVVDEADLKTIEFKISGMTCASCEEHVNHEVNKLNGIVNSQSSFENSYAVIEFDVTKTNEAEIEKAINSTGYTVIDKNIKE